MLKERVDGDTVKNKDILDKGMFTVSLINVDSNLLDDKYTLKGEYRTVSDYIHNYNQECEEDKLTLGVDYVIVLLDKVSIPTGYTLGDAIKELECIVGLDKLILFTTSDEYYNLDKDLKYKANKLESVVKLRKIDDVILGRH